MPLHLVIDPTARPAEFGRVAAAIAHRRGARFLHLAARFDLVSHPDAEQYVHAAGGLGPSGLYFAERILGAPIPTAVTPEAIIAATRQAEVVVPIHPAFGQRAVELREASLAAGIAYSEEIASAEASEEVEPRTRAASPTICLVGRESDHRNVYPAALASLQDAATCLGFEISIRFIDPERFDEEALEGAAGILLPGGSDMGNVPGQIRVARHGLEQRVPMLGLCLGMQTMTTAFAQRVLGNGQVNLTEADPTAPTKSFIAMADVAPAVLPAHRTGDAASEIAPGSRLAGILDASTMSIRCNHRYHLAPWLRPALAEAGLVFSATSFGDRVVDAVEWPQHPFFLGLQGHPELTFVDGAPHPVFAAFLRGVREDS